MALLPLGLTLWGRTSSSNTQKVLWTLHEAGCRLLQPGQRPANNHLAVSFISASARLGPSSELLGEREVFGVVGTAEYGELNPHQMIPTLRIENPPGSDDDESATVLWESNTICRYLAQAFAPELHGRSAEGLAQASMWMDWVLHGSNFAPSFGSANHHLIDQTARTPPPARDLHTIRTAHEEYLQCLAVVEGHLERSGRDFLVGEGFGVGDVPFGVELNRWSLCVHRAQPSAALPPRCCPALLPCLALRAFCSCAQHQADGG